MPEPGVAVWADPSVAAALDPGPRDLDRTPDVLVVGGGVLGLFTAAMCVRTGLGRVQVIERGTLFSGPSGSAAGALAPGAHPEWPDGLRALGDASLALYRELDGEWSLGVRDVDWLVTAPDARAGWDDAGTEPHLGRVGSALLVPGQAHVDPVRLAASLAARAGRVATRVEALAVGGTRVVTSAGSIDAGAVVLATGTHSGVAPGVLKGHLIATRPASFRLRFAVQGEGIIVVQLPDGRIVAGGTLEPDDTTSVVDAKVVAAIVDALARLVPDAHTLDVSHAWCCLRPAASDGLPVIDRLGDGAWVTAGHLRTGLLMAPATGRALADWISGGRRPPEIEAFAARYSGGD